jgi:translation elongation factor EF-4
MRTTFGIDPSEIIQISAKTGQGVQQVLEAIIERLPSPQGLKEAPLKAFLFDSLWVNILGFA